MIKNMTTANTDNPFYLNPLFSESDVMRRKPRLDWMDRFFLMFRKTYVQTSDGWAFFYKRSADGRIWIMKAERYDQSEIW